MERAEFEAEVDRNYEVFEAELPRLLQTHPDKVALLKGGQILDFFDTESAALAAGRSRFVNGLFSIQEVTSRPVDLGFFSHAIDPRLA